MNQNEPQEPTLDEYAMWTENLPSLNELLQRATPKMRRAYKASLAKIAEINALPPEQATGSHDVFTTNHGDEDDDDHMSTRQALSVNDLLNHPENGFKTFTRLLAHKLHIVYIKN